MLEIIPAIDLLRGKAVRLQRGDFASETRVAEDPVKVAAQFAADGATFLHIVDLDGARTGDPQNLAVVRDIIRRVPNLRVQVGGGIRTPERAEQVLRIGAARIIVGTTAASDAAVISAMLDKYADQIIVGADTKDDHVAVHGWLSASKERTEDFGLRLAGMGARRFLYTDVSRDGMLEGVNSQATVAFARATGKPTLASGGVSGPEDIKTLTELQPHGVEGVIIGKALYGGRLTVADALRIARVGADRIKASAAPPPGSTGPLPDWLKEG
ncbi:MAG: 1-(5-phosphoribosyl)-5-[(5-phosphoribosylamino)methylideneamino]imidazole-4-carboxamide isomerase [Akkermansiaceae bacterium]|nr:1-(5-phosphoribosyl)-5-[(5-phosphoribosylamino)methylideneamino]imidazole-4-carboxamide isomerase [Armatimonadota bacterium]